MAPVNEPPRKSRRPRKATPKSIENAAFAYLGRFATSAENLRRVLMRKVERSARAHGTERAEGAAAVDALIARFTRSGLLDDGAYAEGRALSLHRRGASVRAIRLKLRQKGVAGELVEEAVARLAEETPEPELTAALRLAERRRLGPYRAAAARPEKRDKDLAALARAGFSYDVALRVVDAESAQALTAEIAD